MNFLRKTGARALGITLAAGLVLSACGSSDEGSGSDGDVLGSVDTMFGTVEVPKPDGDLRVVALGWSDAETALALDVKPIAVLDWQGFSETNKGVGPWATDRFGDDTPTVLVSSSDGLNYEQIDQLDPDLILNTRSAGDKKEYERLSTIAPTVYAPTGTAAFGTTWDEQMKSVSEAVGKADEGKKLIAETTEAIEAAAAAHPEFEGLTAVSAAKFGDAYGAYVAGDGRFDILAGLGMVNSDQLDGLDSAGFFVNVPGERVSVFDVDLAVILPIGFTVADVASDDLLQSLQVVKDGRAVVLDPDSELGGAWGAASTLSIKVVLDELVPQLADAAAKL